MTYRELCARLSASGIEDAEFDAACLLEHFASADRLALLSDPERDHSSPDLEAAVLRRISHEPLQYILGEWDFYRQSYEVSPACLIPRSDTEILVEEAIRILPRGAHFADLCTGSGCIAISTLAERPDTTAYAFEKYPDTMALAQKNAVRNGVDSRIRFSLSDVLEPPALPDACFDAILSNPPYIPGEVLPTLSPEVHREPAAALDGGEDGLIFYRAILTHWARTLKADGRFLFEIGYDQADAVTRLARECGFSDIRLLRDYGGNDRVLVISRT